MCLNKTFYFCSKRHVPLCPHHTIRSRYSSQDDRVRLQLVGEEETTDRLRQENVEAVEKYHQPVCQHAISRSTFVSCVTVYNRSLITDTHIRQRWDTRVDFVNGLQRMCLTGWEFSFNTAQNWLRRTYKFPDRGTQGGVSDVVLTHEKTSME
jgi:hypothetical protein